MQTSTDLVDEMKGLDIISELCQELGNHRIIYCHWKSNAALSRSASGENDLDLLISRADKQRFLEILARLGFKQAVDKPAHLLPGVVDYYGRDPESNHLVHVHAHFQLILGHDATKNYHIPIEDAYLASATRQGIFMVPSAEFELVILVIRLVLKHFSWDVILLRQGHLLTSEKKELEYLLHLSSRPQIDQILSFYLPTIKPELFYACLELCRSNQFVGKKIRMGRLLLRSLDAYARRPQAMDSFLKIWRRFEWPIKKRILHRDDRKEIGSGGLLAAIVGGDGAGKTTVVEGVSRWLGEEFEVYRFHMGKPEWFLLTVLVRGLIKIGRSLGFYPFQQAEIRYTKDLDDLVFPGYPWLIREICTARDRYLTYRKARRYATNGAVVILDRFPLKQIEFMDGPQAERFTGKIPRTRLLQMLIDLEASYYQKIDLPDLLIVLRVEPETAVKRKVDEESGEVRARSTEIWNIDWKNTSAVVVDAKQSKDEVLKEVEGIIWSRL